MNCAGARQKFQNLECGRPFATLPFNFPIPDKEGPARVNKIPSSVDYLIGIIMRALLIFVLSTAAFPQVRPAVMPEISTSNLPANLPAQPIGPNDLISVSVYDAPEFSRAVRVGADGQIRFPMLKAKINAQGELPSALEVSIAGALTEEDLIVDPFVTVEVVEYASRPINVTGSVRKPLTFQAVGPVTLLDAIARAEGLSPEAGPEILVERAGPGSIRSECPIGTEDSRKGTDGGGRSQIESRASWWRGDPHSRGGEGFCSRQCT